MRRGENRQRTANRTRAQMHLEEFIHFFNCFLKISALADGAFLHSRPNPKAFFFALLLILPIFEYIVFLFGTLE